MSYLIHYNENHDPKTGQFTFAQGANLAKQARTTTEATSQIVDRFSKTKKRPRSDLSNMTDQQLRDLLNREEMERRYDTYFNTPTERRGARTVKDILAIAGAAGTIVVTGLTATSIAMSIAAKMREKRGVA